MNTDTEAVLKALAYTPRRLTKLSRGVDDDGLARRPSADEWSATEIVAHLRSNADVWGSTIQRMLDEDHPSIRYVSPRGALKKPEYSQRAFAEALALFVAGRRKLVSVLKTLPPDSWSRAATFTGTTRRHETVLAYAQRMAAHEAEHLVQFEALLTT